MSFYPDWPASLADAEFAEIRFGLELFSPCTLEPADLLGLRPLLHAAAGALPEERRNALFSPELSRDPAALRRYQKPAPPFVLRSAPGLSGVYREGDHVELGVLFLGTGTMAIGDFLATLSTLGKSGLVRGEGHFTVDRMQCLGNDGKWHGLWHAGRAQSELVFELLRLDQWLDHHWPTTLPVVFSLDTPTRLVAKGRVLRHPRFQQIFPFLLRRVTSMLHAHCALEPVDEPGRLLEAAAKVESVWLEHRWIDWRDCPMQEGQDAIGGCVGQLQLDGPELETVLWIILLATLFGVGKGAAYGAGSCFFS